jgi:hypothetical protein
MMSSTKFQIDYFLTTSNYIPITEAGYPNGCQLGLGETIAFFSGIDSRGYTIQAVYRVSGVADDPERGVVAQLHYIGQS